MVTDDLYVLYRASLRIGTAALVDIEIRAKRCVIEQTIVLIGSD